MATELITDAAIDCLYALSIADPPIDDITICRRIPHVGRPRQVVERFLKRGYVTVSNSGYIVTKAGLDILARKIKSKPKHSAPPRTFKKDGLYKGLKLIGIREGSLDFLSIPAVVNGKDVEVYPCLKS